ncbi:hypothetical protein AU467_18905 [Mesorhizobium loti]|uniref:histidine kinase n=1 Tax=Rhizobium loti TaxID=381 RepID=A0A101KTX0_RHILI|nr:hypothetical protein AU467_18905 [Mesorhizobium loti]
MRPATFSLRGRLTIAMLLIFVLGVGTSALFTYVEVYGTIKTLRKRSLQGQAHEFLEQGLSVAADGSMKVAPPPEWTEAYRRHDLKFTYTLYDAGGHAVAKSPNLDGPLPLIAVGPVEAIGPDEKVALATAAPDGHVLIVARAHASLEALAESLFEEHAEHVLVLLIFVLGALPLIWLICGWSLRRIARASREAAAIGPSSSPARLSTDGLPQEIRPLVDATNDALQRMARAIEAERHLTADAAHQLRTPLTVLDLRLQRARIDGGGIDWEAVTGDMAQLRRLVGQLIDLARMDNSARAVGGPVGDMAEVNLSRLAREAAAAALPMAEAMGRDLSVDATPEATLVKGQADQLRDAIGALIENALTHGEGSVRVSVGPAHRNGAAVDTAPLVRIVVRDEGQGVPLELRETAFDRFRKGNQASPGAGLGLAIVRQIVRLHGGTVGFGSEDEGWVRVEIPAASAPQLAANSGRAHERDHKGAIA